MRRFRYLLLIGVLAAPLSQSRAQDDEKVRKMFQDAIQALGGDTYLNVKDVASEGNYFIYNAQGDSSGLIKFDTYVKLPDKVRFELGNKKKDRDITVFDLAAGVGWILEQPKDLRAATPEEMKAFKADAKHDIDNILHFRWKDPNNKLFYLGPGEGDDVTLEMVQVLDPENDSVTVYFDRISKLPAKVEYQSVNKRGIRERNVQEFSQWHMIEGVNTPLRVDGYANKRRTFSSYAVKVDYNSNLPDSLFTKPEQPK